MVKSSGVIVRFVDRVAISAMVGIFVFVTILCAAAYRILGCFGHGLAPVDTSLPITLVDALYFSIVTISSLGYGDIHPVGISRAIASVEVIAGLVIIGLAISKLASERTGYLLRRIYSSDVQQRLKYFSDNIDRCQRQLSVTDNHGGEEWTELVNETFALIDGAKKFIGFEAFHGTLFDLVPPKAFRNLIDAISHALGTIVSQASKGSVTGKRRRTVKNMLKWSSGLTHTLSHNSTNEDVLSVCALLEKHIADYRKQLKEDQPEQGVAPYVAQSAPSGER